MYTNESFLLIQDLGSTEWGVLGAGCGREGGASQCMSVSMGTCVSPSISQYKPGGQWRKDGGNRKRDSKYQF